ncbi:ATP-binding protein [Thaumasiovibrio subtropicus]|uniref:ATP-binding protein n=1 Tax=Thaumasiovibrio subtropicus TaxID=1891207 RepID=UPI000B35F6A7|nr:sensor histidine kinase [Thaumasiovibrio subtropicus]
MTFNKKILLSLLAVLLLQAAVWWLTVVPKAMTILRQEVAARAMVQSRQIAELDTLRRAVSVGDVDAVKALVDGLYAVTDADFIVIGDKQGHRMAHPIAERIGEPIMGGDIEAALQSGEHYLSESVGSLGRSLRYISPIVDDDGRVVGMIKVGYLIDTLTEWKRVHWWPIFIIAISTVFFSSLFTLVISRWIRRGMQGLEPDQLVRMLDLKRVVLNATHEGVIAIDKQNCIVECNRNAAHWLELTTGNGTPFSVIGANVDDVIQSDGFCSARSRDISDAMAQFNGKTVIASRVHLGEPLGGCVVSFRLRDEISLLTQQLSQIRQHTESLRIMRHEYANKLTTIGGLIQMGNTDKALALIDLHSAGQQRLVDQLAVQCQLDMLSGLLIGKYHRAQEQQITFKVAEDSAVSSVPLGLSEEALCAVIGNLIDNSFTACAPNAGCVELFISDKGAEFVISVTDNGIGIAADEVNHVFQMGVSSKSEQGHGIGLYLVKRYVEEAGGYIEVDSEPGMTNITIYIAALKERVQC